MLPAQFRRTPEPAEGAVPLVVDDAVEHLHHAGRPQQQRDLDRPRDGDPVDELVERRPIDATLKDFASERREGCEYYEQQTIGGLQCREKIA